MYFKVFFDLPKDNEIHFVISLPYIKMSQRIAQRLPNALGNLFTIYKDEAMHCPIFWLAKNPLIWITLKFHDLNYIMFLAHFNRLPGCTINSIHDQFYCLKITL